jgi:hypothetical protein
VPRDFEASHPEAKEVQAAKMISDVDLFVQVAACERSVKICKDNRNFSLEDGNARWKECEGLL